MKSPTRALGRVEEERKTWSDRGLSGGTNCEVAAIKPGSSAAWPAFARRERKKNPATPVGVIAKETANPRENPLLEAKRAASKTRTTECAPHWISRRIFLRQPGVGLACFVHFQVQSRVRVARGRRM